MQQKKEGIYTFCDSIDRTGDYYAKWNKPVSVFSFSISPETIAYILG